MTRPGAWAVLIVVAGLGVSGCGLFGGGVSSTTAITLLLERAPNALDPGRGDGSPALEAEWLAYTPLLTYEHAGGSAGTELIPGLASAMPSITDSGTTYQLTLRPGLVYSDGRRVRASDFTLAVKRAIRLHWGGAPSYITSQIVGAQAFADGRTRQISGITTDNATGQITIKLVAARGWFEDVLAFPALGLVPRGTPLRVLTDNMPPGVGPYLITNVVPGRSFSLIRNPLWARMRIPGIPSGHVNVNVEISANTVADTRSVLDGAADVFDSSDRIPPRLEPTIERDAKDRVSSYTTSSTYLIFFDVTRPPFSSELVRKAVAIAMSEPALSALDGGNLLAGCFLLPPAIPGHPGAMCPEGAQLGTGDIAQARALVRRSRATGDPVTLFTQPHYPYRRWISYYASILDQIGLRASVTPVSANDYYRAIAAGYPRPQTGIGLISPLVPSPSGFYRVLVSSPALGAASEDWGGVADPNIDSQVTSLAAVPDYEIDTVAGLWQALDQYAASKDYVLVLGYRTVPQLVSKRVDRQAMSFNPQIGLDWSSLRLK